MTILEVWFYIVAFCPFVPGTKEKDAVLVVFLLNDFEGVADMLLEVFRSGIDVHAFFCAHSWASVPLWHDGREDIVPCVFWGEHVFDDFGIVVFHGRKER